VFPVRDAQRAYILRRGQHCATKYEDDEQERGGMRGARTCGEGWEEE
jgi:hypothetical protein